GGPTMAETQLDRVRCRADGEHQAERADSGHSGDEELDCSHIMLSSAGRLAGHAGLRALIKQSCTNGQRAILPGILQDCREYRIATNCRPCRHDPVSLACSTS